MKRQEGCGMTTVWLGVVTSGFLSMASVCSGAQYVWTQKTDMPTPRWTHTSAVVNGKIYVIGGLTSQPGEKALSTVEEYDPVANTWTRKTDMPTARGNMIGSSAVVDGKIYVIGGDDNVSWAWPTVEEYDPATDIWTRKADMPTSRWSLATCAVEGKIYAIGGAPGGYTGLNVVEQYDPATNTWTRKADMPTAVWGLCACVVNGKIYALGGRPGTTAIPSVQEYDPATDTWTRKADMLVATSQMASVVLDDKIVVIGGWHISSRVPYTTVQMYDPETDVWTKQADTPFLRAVFTAGVVNNRIYAIGGTDRPHPCIATATVYELTIHGPPPDFNADGSVDIQDLLTLIESWGQNDPLVDIAPPFGDGLVDVLDLECLMGYWGQELDDPTLVAHWALDETEGIVAHDRAGASNGTIMGLPQWRPQGGRIDGALELNGTTFVTAKSAPSLATDPFSVLAWVKGGGPGQVVVSQQGGVNWLMADAATGALVTELSKGGRTGGGLSSQATITDGDWHRIAFTWDGTHRRLYVDGLLVAEDTQDSLAPSSGNAIIGAAKNMAPGTFWKGPIDDVRIYNRAVKP